MCSNIIKQKITAPSTDSSSISHEKVIWCKEMNFEWEDDGKILLYYYYDDDGDGNRWKDYKYNSDWA